MLANVDATIERTEAGNTDVTGGPRRCRSDAVPRESIIKGSKLTTIGRDRSTVVERTEGKPRTEATLTYCYAAVGSEAAPRVSIEHTDKVTL